jgi:prephenate dehydrogenase
MSRPEVAIIGLGLIGGSIGLALRRAEPNFKIIGHDKDRSVAKKALKLGAIEKEEWNLISAVEGADLVIIATPVMAIREVFEATAPYLKTECVITDTSSVKEEVLKWAEELLPETVHFVGGNPIVNKDETGIDAASADLFRKSTYCIVPSVTAHPAAIELVTSMVRTLGAEPFFLDPAEHDGQVGGVEHLPLVTASALLMTTADAPSWRDIRRLPSSNFWRVTHLPSTDPKNYRDTLLANRDNISRWIDMYIDNLRELQERLVAADTEEWWEKFFTELIDTRNRWLEGKFIAEEEASAQALQEIGGFRSLGSMIGLSQFRDLKEKLEKREPK